MPIRVTDYTCLLKLDNYAEVVYVQKSKLSVSAEDNYVSIRWDSDHHLRYLYSEFQAPVAASAILVAAAISNLINATCNGGGGGGGGGGNPLIWDSFDDSAPYVNADLIGMTPDVNFVVFTDHGSGALNKVTDAYTFNATTGTITVPGGSGAYRVGYTPP